MGTVLVTIIYIKRHDSRTNPGNRYEDICRGTSVTNSDHLNEGLSLS